MIHKRAPYRRMQEQKAKKRMADNSTCSYRGYYGSYFKNDHWAILDKGKKSKWLKRQANKKLRRDKEFIGSNGSYKKKFDYWWEMI